MKLASISVSCSKRLKIRPAAAGAADGMVKERNSVKRWKKKNMSGKQLEVRNLSTRAYRVEE